MTTTGRTTWTELTGLPAELLALAERCYAADDGLPLAIDPSFLGRRWAADGGSAFGLTAADGSLVAAGAARLTPGGPAFTGLVDPAVRGRGLGSALLDHGLALASELAEAKSAAPDGRSGRHAAGSEVPGKHAADSEVSGERAVGSEVSGEHAADNGPSGEHAGGSGASGKYADVTVETETLTDDAAALFEARGLRQVFAEQVMRIELDDSLPGAEAWPAGVTVVSWSGAVAPRFHATYHAAFSDRPGFPGDPAEEWIAENENDDDFRPECSLLVTLPDLGDVGFIIAARDWVVQVGVVPLARRRGLAAATILDSLSRMRAAGDTRAWLTVNVNNPGAAALYRRLGFTGRGRRARYQP
ncbi:GNAT family N-acetyltransferase [Paractinoplanes hotanensis]|uniref:GNAT family N-acetyltransferase n=1 Tax=Paractinoplanes hotanensis TaxID=2906497 RepID=A0ABT0Y6Z7_9ACTN|nr:GNAT family N-acetyltransferase [Actinoplanes hotanensis]MCM4081318.1 GNAT family N-acetyltransferase [Actinoplanes hotanensis]